MLAQPGTLINYLSWEIKYPAGLLRSPEGPLRVLKELETSENQPTYGGLPILFDGPSVLTKSIGHITRFQLVQKTKFLFLLLKELETSKT